MALNIYYDKDADLGRLAGKTVAVIGYGSQGHAHAQNLHASGVKVVVGLRKDSASWAKAEGAGLEVATVADAARRADVIMLTLPDELAADVYREEVAPNIEAGTSIARRSRRTSRPATTSRWRTASTSTSRPSRCPRT